jgi:hypothetical protein
MTTRKVHEAHDLGYWPQCDECMANWRLSLEVCGPTWSGDDCERPTGHTGNHRAGDLVWTTTSPSMYRAARESK